MKFGVFYEHQVPRPWAERRRAPGVRRGDRTGRVLRPDRHRLVLARGAPLPRGVQPLVGARDLPRRALAAHQEPALGPRHHAHAAVDQSPGARRPSGSRPSTSSRADGSSSAPARARRPPSSTRSASTPTTSARMWEEGLRVALRCMTETPFTGFAGDHVRDAAAQRRAEADTAAASTGVGRVHSPRDDPPRRAARDRRAVVRVLRSRGGASRGSTTTTRRSRPRASRSATP